MRNYIVSRNGLTLVFQSTMPNRLLPHVGDKLVTTEVDEIITNAFVGQVAEVNYKSEEIEIVCNPVDLADVFETYYGIIRKTDEPVVARQKSLSSGFFGMNGTRTFCPGKLSFDLLNSHQMSVSYQEDDELSYSIERAQATVSLTPTVDYNAYLIVNKNYGTNISVTAIGNYTLEEYFALAGNITVGDEVPLFEKAIPIPEALIDVFFEFGIFANFKATLSAEQTWTQKYRHVFHWEWSSKVHETLNNMNVFKPVANSHMGKIALNGSLNVGAYGKVGISFIATSSLDIAQVDLRAEGGISVEGTYVPYKRDEEYARKSTDLYNQIKDKEVGAYWYYGLSAEANLFKWSVSAQVPDFLNIPLNKKGKIVAVRLVPLFSDTKLTKDESGIYYASAKVKGVVLPTDVGFALINQKDEEDAVYTYSISNYQGPKAENYVSFFDKPASKKYIVYPLVKYLGMELIAEPTAKIAEPEILFRQAEIVKVDSEPKYNGDGEYLFTWYTARFKYIIQISDADLIDYIQPVIYDNGTWTYNGGKTKVPGNGLFSVTTTMSYDDTANMNWKTGYRITLKDGSVVYSINTLQFGGTPEAPTISIGESVNSAANFHKSIKQTEGKYGVLTLGEFDIKRIYL